MSGDEKPQMEGEKRKKKKLTHRDIKKEGNIKINLKTEYCNVNWIHLDQDKVNWQRLSTRK
jgi:hypothetical protein